MCAKVSKHKTPSKGKAQKSKKPLPKSSRAIVQQPEQEISGEGTDTDTSETDFLSRPAPLVITGKSKKQSHNQNESRPSTSGTSKQKIAPRTTRSHADTETENYDKSSSSEASFFDFLTVPGPTSGQKVDSTVSSSASKSRSSVQTRNQSTSSDEENGDLAESSNARNTARTTATKPNTPSKVTTTSKKPPSRARKQPKPKKRKEHVVADIIKYQQSWNKLIPMAPFHRLVREIMQNIKNDSWRTTKDALEALQEATEMYLVQLFEDSYMCTLHRMRVTLSQRDIQLAINLRGPNEVGAHGP